jgi:hypothetical protein
VTGHPVPPVRHVRRLRAIAGICTVRSVPSRLRAPRRAGPRSVRFTLILAALLGALLVVGVAAPALALDPGAAPAVTAIWPRSGPVGGGTSLTVVGAGFTGATQVTVAGAPADGFTVVSDTVVQVTAPASPTAGEVTGPVAVTTPGGTSLSTPLGAYAYRAAGTSIMVPSYIAPGSSWSQINAGHPPVDLAIINPASGPGSSPASNYASQVVASHGAGVDVVGYVHTSYGSRSLATVEKEIAEYESWYHVDGIFVDEASTSCSTEASYYAPLYAYIHAQSGLDLTILNPGEATNQCYMAAADVVLGFEGSPSDLAKAGPLPSWTAGFPAGRFWGVVYGASSGALASTLATLATDGFGEVYVTDQNLPNPYGALPTYWSQELAAATGTGTGTTPPPGSPTPPPPPPGLTPQVVTFTSTPPTPAAVGARYSVTATGGASGQRVVVTVDATSGAACTISRGSVTFAAAGTCVIDANQAGTSTYAPAVQAQQLITVVPAPPKAAPAFTSASSYSVPAGQSFSFVVTATGTPAPTISISGSLPSGVTLSGGPNGTATISGNVRRSRTYRVTITASNGTGRAATQNFTLTIS